MRTIEGVRRSGVAVRPDETIQNAAALMDHAGVGSLASSMATSWSAS